MALRSGLCVLALTIFLHLTQALPSLPTATDPILVTATVSTILPSLITVYSMVPATDEATDASAITTTPTGGILTTVTTTGTGVIAGSFTSTIISTISLTTSQVVVSTVGYSTLFGPDNQTISAVSSIPVAAPSISETPLVSVVSSSTILPTTASSLVAATPSSSTSPSTSARSSSTNAAVTGVSDPSSTSVPTSHSKELSISAKVGIGISVAIGIIFLIILSFWLGYSHRCKSQGKAEHGAASIEGLDTFRAGHPYESQTRFPTLTADKGHAYSTNTTIAGSGSPTLSGKSYDLPQSPPMTALPQITKADDQIFVGVPAHMSGSRRWSMKEFLK